jgi:D-alanyl-D-alanine endopeptidase (penicillin-binding protein 7)
VFSHSWARVVLALSLAAPLVMTLHAPEAHAAGRPRLTARSGAHAGRTGARRPRHPTVSRRVRSVPWLKGNLPNVQAQGAYVLDLGLGHELFARRPDEPRPIASISKLAATLVVVDRGLDLDKTTTITRTDVDVARGGARSRLMEGMTLPNRDLLHAALLGSDNRAVPALGRAVGLEPAQLAAAMTAKVRELGLKNTRFVEPTGLSPENVSTPRELVDLLRTVIDHPVLGPVTQTVSYDAHPVGRAPIHYNNTHRPAARPNTVVIGGKTGFNNAARYCLVLAARVAGHTVAMAFLGTEGEMTRFGDVARVADWVAMQEAKESPPSTMLASGPRTSVPPVSAKLPQASAAVLPALPALPSLPSLPPPGLAPAVAAAPAAPASPSFSPPPLALPSLPSAVASGSEAVSSPVTAPPPPAPPAPAAPTVPEAPLPPSAVADDPAAD